MKYVVAAYLVSSLIAVSAANAANCIDADPQLELGGVQGDDFELAVDPQDAAGSLIYNSPTADGLSSIVIAKINGKTGKVVFGSLTTIANNYNGQNKINGPEFVQKPTGELGLVYAGDGGVHGVFRPATQTRWNNFKFDVSGAKLLGDPPVLPNTNDGSYPKGGIPLGQNTYTHKLGDCSDFCYGALDKGSSTDVAVAAAAHGLTVHDSTQSARDGYILFRACKTVDNCGLYEGLIDQGGGIAKGTFQRLASIGTDPGGSNRLRAVRHPVTGSTVIFAAGKTNIATTVDVWEQPAAGGKLTLVDRVRVSRSSHYRIVTSTTEAVLHYRIRDHADHGSYTIPVTANGSTLVVGQNKRISRIDGGSELAWLPAADRWAFYYRQIPGPLTLCWVKP